MTPYEILDACGHLDGVEMGSEARPCRECCDRAIKQAVTDTIKVIRELPEGCTGTIAHSEYTLCPIHDWRR